MSVLTLRDVPQEDARPSRPSPEERLHDLFEDHSGRVLAYAFRRTGSREAAKDVVSETFIVAWQKIDDVPSDGLPWLLAVARRVLSHQYRSSQSQRALLEKLKSAAKASPEVQPSGEEGTRERLRAAFQSLRPEDQEALALADWEGLSNQEAANVLGVSPAAFAVRLHRSRRRLAAALRDEGYQPQKEEIATREMREVE
jgi:RNA polymerase sigma-70 factor, ECF subfamily